MEPVEAPRPFKSLRFVDLQESHLPEILAIEKASNGAPWSERAFRNEIGHRHGIFVVALADGKVAGYGGVWMVVDEAHVTNVAVDPALRRQGIGRKIVVDLLKRAREMGCTCSTLEVRAGNEAAIQLYENLGYVRSAVRKDYYPDNREDALVMWLHDLSGWQPS